MKSTLALSLLGLCQLTTATGAESRARQLLPRLYQDHAPTVHARASPDSSRHRFLNDRTRRFAVNGTGIPDVDFDVGESYAGLLPISDNKNETDNLYFWFFPTDNEEQKKKKEITIWLNGGPGCSSLIGFLQENGPFLWQPGSIKPSPNPWSWHHLTNVVWIEQPVGVGFSAGNATVHDEDELSRQFMGFWKNFIKTFSMQGYKIYITGESYGGYYCPYIASNFLDANDDTYFDVGGLLVVDGRSFNSDLQTEVGVESFLEQNYNTVPLDDNLRASIRKTSKACGYHDYIKQYYTFPPAGKQPSLLPWQEKFPNGTVAYKEGCGGLWETVIIQLLTENPCFNHYNIHDHCPLPYDPLNEPMFFNRQDVKKAINAPLIDWISCTPIALTDGDPSPPPSEHALPNVIDKTRNVIYVHGGADLHFPASGLFLGVQNMTWGGRMGFQSRPTDPFYVPRYALGDIFNPVPHYGDTHPGQSGVVGTTHEERGFTVVVTATSGHLGPQNAPLTALRQMEKLLGRVGSLSDTAPFTLPQLRNITQVKGPLGKGTFAIPWVYTP